MSPQDLADLIRDEMLGLAGIVVERQFREQPELKTRYGGQGRAKCLQDTAYHLQYLAAALEAGRPTLFADYVDWVRLVLQTRNIPGEHLVASLDRVRDVIRERLPAEEDQAFLEPYFADALRSLQTRQQTLASSLDLSKPTGRIADDYLKLVLAGRRAEAVDAVLAAVSAGLSVKQLYLEVFQPVQYEVGRLWQTNAITVAQEHYCSAVTQLTMSRLYPEIFSSEKNGRRLVAACVSGDLHEIGLRMVADVFEIDGWDTFYIGANTPATAIVDAVQQHNADVLALSATMTYHVGPLRSVITALRASAGGAGVRVIVGGRIFLLDPSLVEWVGADGSSADAGQAVGMAEQLVAGG